MRIEDIPSLEAAKTEIAKMSVRNRNLEDGIKKIIALLKSAEIVVGVDINAKLDKHKIRLYGGKGLDNTIGHATEVIADPRGDGLFDTGLIQLKCTIDLQKLVMRK